MVLAWRILGGVAFVTFLLILFVVIFDDDNKDKKDGGKHE